MSSEEATYIDEGTPNVQDIRVDQGATQIQMGDDVLPEAVQHQDITNVQAQEKPSSAEGILASAAHPITGSKAASITPETMVDVGGMKTTVDNACRMGLLQETPQGYVEVEQKAAPEPTAEADPDTLRLDHHSATLNTMLNDTAGDMTMMKVTKQVLNGETVSDESVRDLARKTGLGDEEVFQHISHMVDQYQAHVDNFVKEFGVEDPQEFYSWMQENVPSHEFQSRLYHYAETRNPKASFGKHLNTYLQKYGPIDESNQDAEFYTNKGVEMVRIDGVGEMTVATARRLNIL